METDNNDETHRKSMLNIITNGMPDSIEVDGKEYKIYTDFREFIELTEIIESKDTSKLAEYLIGLFIFEVPENQEEAIHKIELFLNLNKEREPSEGGQKKSPSFSFSEDSAYILGAFREVYGIDLAKIKYMHWFEFNALMMALPQETELKKRIYYRSIDASKIKNKSERARIKAIQRNIAIKQPEEMTDEEIGAALL